MGFDLAQMGSVTSVSVFKQLVFFVIKFRNVIILFIYFSPKSTSDKSSDFLNKDELLSGE